MKIWIKEIILTTGLQVKYSAKGNEVVAAINKYNDMKSVLGTDVKYASIVKEVNLTFGC
jgi:hypothetical protein